MATSDIVIKKLGEVMAPVVAKNAVETRLKKLGKEPATASREDCLKVLDDIEKSALTPVLGAGVAKEKIDAIRASI